MNEKRQFKVEGRAYVRYYTYCDCDGCIGHEQYQEHEIGFAVMASSPKDAADEALEICRANSTQPAWDAFVEWVGKPTVLDLERQQDILMCRAGAPVLPGLELLDSHYDQKEKGQ